MKQRQKKRPTLRLGLQDKRKGRLTPWDNPLVAQTLVLIVKGVSSRIVPNLIQFYDHHYTFPQPLFRVKIEMNRISTPKPN